MNTITNLLKSLLGSFCFLLLSCDLPLEFKLMSRQEYIDSLPKTNGDSSTADSLIINEIDCDTVSIDTLEFIELYDGGAGNTSLTGFVLVFYSGAIDKSYYSIDLDGYSTDANGYFLLGNGAVTPVPSIIFSDNTLQNGPDAVALYKGNATDFPNGTPLTVTNIVDALVYHTADVDDPELSILLNSGQPQIDENGQTSLETHSIQRYTNGSGGQRNTSTFIQALPTPGAANSNAL